MAKSLMKVVTLGSGDHGDLVLNGQENVAYVGLDPVNPPTFNSVNVRDCHGIRFKGLKFQWGAEPGEPSYSSPNAIDGGSSDIKFVDCQRIGSEVDGVPIGRGMMISADVTGVSFIRDKAMTWASALFNFGNKTLIDSSRWTDTSEDIIQNNGTQGYVIQHSTFGFFRIPEGSEAHVDFAQWQHYGAIRPSKDILIHSNDFHSGYGRETAQCMFFGHEDLFKPGAATFGKRTTNIEIYDNVVYSGHTHGISAYGCDGVKVYNNTLLRNPAVKAKGFSEDTYNPGIDEAESLNVDAYNNIAASAPTPERNLILKPADYGKYFPPEVILPRCPIRKIRALSSAKFYGAARE